MKKKRIAILIVAAGESKRLGQPKQLVKKNGISLLENSLIEAIKSKVGDVFLILGAHAELIISKMQISDFQVFINNDWKKGMGESIAYGIKAILKKGNYNGVIISVADQPFLTADILKELEENILDEEMIIKSKYVEGSGPPVYFSSHFFEEMKSLSRDDGAKPLVRKYKKQVISIDFPKGNIDIDKEEDLVHWK
jgi:molybdenum cofactor cytidylyltransferase